MLPRRNSSPPAPDAPSSHGRLPRTLDPGHDSEQATPGQRQVTITWRAGSGGWFARIVIGVLGVVLLVTAALISIVVLAWLALGILAVSALVMWKARTGRVDSGQSRAASTRRGSAQ